MTGSPAQLDWAERIRAQLGEEFGRVAHTLRSVALRQTRARRVATETTLTILEEKRAAVLGRQPAAYFIRHWQEIRARCGP